MVFEKRLIFTISLIHFVNILGSVMLMPLGPDFAKELSISIKWIGAISVSYMIAAAFSSLLAFFFIDSFARKKAIIFALCGFFLSTVVGAFAHDFKALILSRALSGVFSGPLVSLVFAMIIDHVPVERRGRAIGTIAGTFSLALMFGLPFGLEISRIFGWKMTLVAHALLILIAIWLGALLLPRHGNTLVKFSIANAMRAFINCLHNKLGLLSFGYIFLVFFSAFLFAPNIAGHIQINILFPRNDLAMLYMIGGTISYIGMRIVGFYLDRTKAIYLFSLTTITLCAAIYIGFFTTLFHPVVFFIIFLLGFSTRNVCGQTLATKIPKQKERGAFMSLIAFFQNSSAALGAYVATFVLVERNERIEGFQELAIIAIAASGISLILFYLAEKNLNAQKR